VQFMALIYGDQSRWESLGADEQKTIMNRYYHFANDARAAGVLSGGEELGETQDATTVRVRNGQTLVTDGPYTETKEVLAGYFLLDCPSWEGALEWAAQIPAVEYGAIEVRPVHVDGEPS
jgi:hypothetical protein